MAAQLADALRAFALGVRAEQTARKTHTGSSATVLPELMIGRASMCFGLSEPNAGSDASMIKTYAKADGDGWLIPVGKSER